jgi:hypothetical protein
MCKVYIQSHKGFMVIISAVILIKLKSGVTHYQGLF